MENIEKNIINDIDEFYKNSNGENIVNPDLIPYACYYDSKTIITQNGELLQIIKIPSFVSNTAVGNFYTLRETLNNTFIKNSTNLNINFWLQTVRKPVDIIPRNQAYKDYTSRLVMEKWNNCYKWEKQFANEIYITIILSPEDNKMSKGAEFLKALNFSIFKSFKLKEFKKMNELLSKTVLNILADLKDYGAKLLKIIKKEDVYYSEHLKFFSLLINGDRNNIKLPINELSESLIRKKIAYGKNSIQIYDNDQSIYTTILSLKYCNHLLLSQLDKIIQLNQEMTITQSVSFIDPKQVNNEMMEYYEILSINENPLILNLSDIGELLTSTEGQNGKVCVSQLLIQLKAKTKDDLEKNIKDLFKITAKLGLVVVREEMFMPTLFWSQLPANFNFIRRFQKISINNIGNFTSLFNFPTGKLTNNHWGDSTIVLKSALNTPYFFSFHTDKNANTLFIGPKQMKKTKYMNLFLLSATKQIKRMIYIDNTNRSKIFINSLNGKYYNITEKNNDTKLCINPFAMEKNEENIKFMVDWLYQIANKYDDGMIKLYENNSNFQQEWDKFVNIFTKNINIINSIQDIFNLVSKEKFLDLIKVFNKWTDKNLYGMIFNNNCKTINLFENSIIGINLNIIINNEELKIAIFDYIVYDLISKSDGKPTILAIDEGWLLFDNEYFGKRFGELLKKLYDKNIAVIMTTSGTDRYEKANIQSSVKKIFPTQILLPNLKATVYQKKVYSISEEESRILSVMREESGNFLLKQGGNIIIASVDFNFLNEEEKIIFSNTNLEARIMEKAKELVNSDNPKIWIPIMFSLIKEYNKAKFEEKLREQEKRQIKWEEAKQSGDNNTVLKSGN